MTYVIAQLSDVHVGGPQADSGERFSAAIAAINAMTRQPDLVLLTGDNTHHGTPQEWDEFTERLAALSAPWEAIAGNHDQSVAAIAGHRAIDAGPLRLVLVDSSREVFAADDAAWLDDELSSHPDSETIIAIHHPPFETGIWWMDCLGLDGAERFEEVVRRHPQVAKVLSGHVHRAIQTNWGSCSLWVSPSTSITIAADLDPQHVPAESAEPPMFSLHARTSKGIVSHLVPVGAAARRTAIDDASFVAHARSIQANRDSLFS